MKKGNKKGFYIGFTALAFSFIVANSINIKNNKEVETRDTDLIVLVKDTSNVDELKDELFNLVGFNYRVVDTYNGLVNGLEIKINSSYIDSIKELSIVEACGTNNVYETSDYKISSSYDSSKTYTASQIQNDSKTTMNVPTSSKQGEGTFLAVIDNGMLLSHKAFKDLDSSTSKRVSKTDMDTAKKQSGFKGKGETYYNSKIVYYYDYGENDNDVYLSSSSHGMHTSSTAVANGEFEGIAPKAQLAFMKVADSEGSISETALINAFNDCYYLGVDAISFSIGSALDEGNDDPIIETLNKLAEKGIDINASAGNDGKGNWSSTGIYKYDLLDSVEDGILGSYATYSTTTSVAAGILSSDDSSESILSVNGTIIDGYDQVISRTSGSTAVSFTTERPFYSLNGDKKEGTYEYVMVPGLGEKSDFASCDVKGKIAVIKRGTISFEDKIANAYAAGAIAVIVGNQDGLGQMQYFSFTNTNQQIPSYGISKEFYNLLASQEDKKITVSRNFMTDFSSQGATGSLSIEPEITAPGQNIIGAVCDNKSNNTYEYYDGTSMAAPNYSGSYVLALSDGDYSTEEERKEYQATLKKRFMSTANPIIGGEDIPTSVRRQGAGMIDVESAIKTNVYLEGTNNESKVELKNNDNIKNGILDFDVTFKKTKEVKGSYTPTLYISVPEVVEVDSEANPNFAGTKVKSTNQRLVKKVTLSNVTLSGKEDQTYHVNYKLTEEEVNEILSDFPNGCNIEGYVIFDSNDSSLEELSIPYLGFIGDYYKEEAVEPFQFEKEDGKIYGSDIVNDLAQNVAGKTKADFESYFGVTGTSINNFDSSKIYKHETKLTDYVMGINATLESDGYYHLKAGNKGSADTLYIQQFVNRSCIDNTITLKDSKGSIVLTDHMFNAIYDNGESTHPLIKTKATTTLYNKDYIIANRAYTIIPLKDTSGDYNYYEDGEYTLEFDYELVDGTHQTKTYILEIEEVKDDNSVTGFEETSEGLLISFSSDCLKVTINDVQGVKKSAKQFLFTKDSLIPDKNGVYTIKAYSNSYGLFIGSMTSDLKAIATGSVIESGTIFKLIRKNTSSGEELTIGVYDSTGKVLKINDGIKVYIALGSGVSECKVTTNDSKKEEIESSLSNGVLSFTTKNKKIILNYSSSNNGSNSNSGLITGLCVGAGAILVAGLFAGITLNKKSKKKYK